MRLQGRHNEGRMEYQFSVGMAPTDNTVARTLHDLGLAAWFGGSLMGAAGVNGAAAVVQDPTQRLRGLGKKLQGAGDVPVEGGTTPNPTTPRMWPAPGGSPRPCNGSSRS
jgi:hypothetical protein